MFYCDSCQSNLSLPVTDQKTLVKCQLCDNWAICNTVHDEDLSIKPTFERDQIPVEYLSEFRVLTRKESA